MDPPAALEEVLSVAAEVHINPDPQRGFPSSRGHPAGLSSWQQVSNEMPQHILFTEPAKLPGAATAGSGPVSWVIGASAGHSIVGPTRSKDIEKHLEVLLSGAEDL
jgi:hypothetical protein